MVPVGRTLSPATRAVNWHQVSNSIATRYRRQAARFAPHRRRPVAKIGMARCCDKMAELPLGACMAAPYKQQGRQKPRKKGVGGGCGGMIEPILLFGIPVDFILFGLTLLGVALFHHHTLAVALTGLAAVTLYKLVFTGFKFGTGLAGLALHLRARMGDPRESVPAADGLCPALAAFRDEPRAGRDAQFPAGRLEGRLRLAGRGVRAVELSRQHRRGADRRHDGAACLPRQGPYRLSRRHRRGFQCRRLRQRRRRHHHHHDVDRRRQPLDGARSLRCCERGAASFSASRHRCSSIAIRRS